MPMKELNLSCDGKASYQVLKNIKNIKIACASNCLESYFSSEELELQLSANPSPLSRYLKNSLKDWYDINKTHWNIDGIINWDVMAAAQMVHPEFFNMNLSIITPTEESLNSGNLNGGGEGISVFLPSVKSRDSYTSHIYERYFSAKVCVQAFGSLI